MEKETPPPHQHIAVKHNIILTEGIVFTTRREENNANIRPPSENIKP